MSTMSSPLRMTVKKVKEGWHSNCSSFVKEGEGRRCFHQTTFSPCCCGGGGCWLCCWSEEFGVADEELFEESKLLFPLLLLLPPPAKERGKSGPLDSVFPREYYQLRPTCCPAALEILIVRTRLWRQKGISRV